MNSELLNSIIKGDCIEVMRKIPSNTIDVTFADPPFNLRKKYNSIGDKLTVREYINWCEIWIREMVRITKPTGSIFVHNIPLWLTHYSEILNKCATFKHWISWDAPTSPMGKSLQPSNYGILYYIKQKGNNKFYEIRCPHKRCRKCKYLHKDYGGKKRMLHPFGPLVSDVWTDIHRVKHNRFRDEHPCQLPIHLMERIILMSSDVGDVIMDPFLGTGTTALAAKRLGRKYIGIEMDGKYVDIANNKICTEQEVSCINGKWVSMYLNKIVTLRDQDWHDLEDFYICPDKREDIDCVPIEIKFNSKYRGTKKGDISSDYPMLKWPDDQEYLNNGNSLFEDNISAKP